jgi:metallophosphoesterase (TIGR00282 family)
MRVLFIGDIVGQPGVNIIKAALPGLIERERIDVVIANAENAAAGSGLSPSAFRQIRAAGVDLVTLGDHVYKKRDIIGTLEKDECICRPANFPAEAPGRDCAVASARDGTRVAVFCLLGRTFMKPADCPFHAADRVLKELEGKGACIVVDVHAEATADKYLLGHHLKGRVAAVIGTHTHVPTADEQILAGGTAFISDVGMTGPYDSILGRRIDRVLATTISFVPNAYEVATDDVRIGAAIVDVDASSGRASAIRRIVVRETDVDGRGAEPSKAAP